MLKFLYFIYTEKFKKKIASNQLSIITNTHIIDVGIFFLVLKPVISHRPKHTGKHCNKHSYRSSHQIVV